MGGGGATALWIVLAAAFLHAGWNAIVKRSTEQKLTMGLIALGHMIVGALMTLWFDPPDPASWVFIAASTAIHWAYYGFLLAAYRHGDLSLVYPVARGIAPVLIAGGAWAVAGERLSVQTTIGIAVVSLAILLLVIATRRKNGADGASVAFALGTGVTIAAYSIADGMGVRASGSPFGYIAWLFLLEGIFFFYVFASAWRRVGSLSLANWAAGAAGGIVSLTAYGLVIYAALLAPLGAISAVRESSVIVAALIGLWLFGERPFLPRLLSAILVAAGVVLIALARN